MEKLLELGIYDEMIRLRRKLIKNNLEGLLAISKDKTYFINTDDTVEITLPLNGNAEILDKYLEDLLRTEYNVSTIIENPYDENENAADKVRKLVERLQQRRINKDRIKSLIYYYKLGKLTMENSEKLWNRLPLTQNQQKKLRLKSSRVYRLFNKIGSHRIYYTRSISVSGSQQL